MFAQAQETEKKEPKSKRVSISVAKERTFYAVGCAISTSQGLGLYAEADFLLLLNENINCLKPHTDIWFYEEPHGSI